MRLCSSLCCLLVILVVPGDGFYVPGVTPVEYKRGATIKFKVNSLTSTRSPIPYDAYAIPSCIPGKRNPKPQHENFGEILWGDSIKPSMYYAHMQINVTCRRLCQTSNYTARQMKTLTKRIEEGYRGHVILDNLPVTEVFTPKLRGYRTYLLGYPLGNPKTPPRNRRKHNVPTLNLIEKTQINNHLAFTIKYHRPADMVAASHGVRIVGFHVTAHSIKHDSNTCKDDDTENAGWYPKQGNPVTVEDSAFTWSYSVNFVEDPELAWSSRWDPYWASHSTDSRIHWFSIINSLLIVLFLSGMVAMILMRALHRDFNRYNDPENQDEAQEETGWKLVHADVFRPPKYCNYLAIYVGSGCQLLGMMVITIFFALLGFLSPANRGGLLTAMLLLYILLGSYAGYVSARFCKMFHCQTWTNIGLTGTFFPGHNFIIWFLLNLVLWGKSASNAVPFTTLLALMGLWFFVSVPLVFVGAVLGYKRPAMEPPCYPNTIPRNIPEQRWYMKAPFTVLMAGILPFGAAFIELFFILSSLWLNRFYYVFGFLALVAIILTVTCAEITIVMVYFQLCYEDYHWWWRSFFVSGSSGFHLFLYSIFYYFTTLHIRGFWSTVVYFTWMFCVSYGFGVLTGTIGFLSSFTFVRFIYSQIKVD
eukprot:TRINITY_DN67427_c12_g3_i1.p1 TRINITY_DN67427_c12_g3~~TRINITY_DN67427_c12_g3_i1.p1  ORF type:complete len:645 (+),score=27.82 TRINITY_DN67427_c12_g3_i1:28-1962(+)